MTIEFVPQVEDKLSPIERLEALCDDGSLTLMRSDVRSRRMGEKARAGDGVIAGAVEAVATILALRDRIAPPTLGLEDPDEGLDLDYVPGKARPLDIDGKPAVGLSNAFGFGGHNAVLCLEAA